MKKRAGTCHNFNEIGLTQTMIFIISEGVHLAAKQAIT